MRYDRTVIAYHGCDAEVAERILAGEPLKKSQNDYDWLGEGVYFWEYGADRALRFAESQRDRGKIRKPAIIGALLQLGNCFDLMDTRFTSELPAAYEMLKKLHDTQGTVMPINSGTTPDKKARRLDCAVLNFYLTYLEGTTGVSYDTVRWTTEIYTLAVVGSGIREQSHVQLAVRNADCILGVFRPQ